jgi:ABC-type nitrate/sulfonate/bicarbonate transport system ATPase subunit
MGNLAVEVKGLTVSRGSGSNSKTVISNLNLKIERGEFVAVVGSSGQGKTTLLHALARLISSSGQVVHAEVSGVPTGLVFQEPRLLPWLSVRENIKLGFRFAANRRVLPLTSTELNKKVDALLADFGIKELADRTPATLSGGQAQRVALARTAVLSPNLLLLDEPFSAVDAVTRAALQEWLREIAVKHQLTTVLVTHDIDEAIGLADRILVMNDAENGFVEYSTASEGVPSGNLKKFIINEIGEYTI